MPTLFDHTNHKGFEVVASRRGKYQHMFGGSAESHGFTFRGHAQPLHVMWVFDTSDPKFPISVDAPLFPLCYGFGFSAGVVSYRVKGKIIEVIAPTRGKFDKSLPYDNYPLSFPSQNSAIRKLPYNSRNAEDAFVWGGIFGLKHLPKKTLKQVAVLADSIGHWDDMDLEGRSREEDLQLEPPSLPFMQGIPPSECYSKDCDHYLKTGATKVICIHRNDIAEQGYPFWGDVGETIQFIFSMCDHCKTVTATHECT